MASTPVWVKAVRLALVGSLIPASVYLAPRVINLVATPSRLDQTIVHADRYNPQLQAIVDQEYETLRALAALDSIAASLRDVRGTVSSVDAELGALIGQISNDVQNVLNMSNAEVEALLARLAALEGRIRGLNQPIGGAASAVAENRRQLAKITKEARRTGGHVRDARGSSGRSADNVDGGS